MIVEYRTPVGIAIAGIILVVVGLFIKDLLTQFTDVGSFLVSVGYVALIVALVVGLIVLLRSLFR